MPATVTLSSTTLQTTIGASDRQIRLTSTSGVLPGYRLWVDRELMTVISLGIDPSVNVQRGVDGTTGQPHNSLSTVYIGRPDQFFSEDPQGRPLAATLVSPHINVPAGRVWFAQGDTTPSGQALRWWQQQTTTYDQGAMGIRTSTTTPTSSS